MSTCRVRFFWCSLTLTSRDTLWYIGIKQVYILVSIICIYTCLLNWHYSHLFDSLPKSTTKRFLPHNSHQQNHQTTKKKKSTKKPNLRMLGQQICHRLPAFLPWTKKKCCPLERESRCQILRGRKRSPWLLNDPPSWGSRCTTQHKQGLESNELKTMQRVISVYNYKLTIFGSAPPKKKTWGGKDDPELNLHWLLASWVEGRSNEYCFGGEVRGLPPKNPILPPPLFSGWNSLHLFHIGESQVIFWVAEGQYTTCVFEWLKLTLFFSGWIHSLEDHPRTWKSLVTMVSMVVGPLPNGQSPWLIECSTGRSFPKWG